MISFIKKGWEKVKTRVNGKSLHFKLLITYIIINIVPILIVGIVSYNVSSKAISEEVKNNNSQIVEGICVDINSYLENLTQVSNTYVSTILNDNIQLNRTINFNDMMTLEEMKTLNDYLNNINESSDDYLSIRLFLDNGQYLMGSYSSLYKLFDYHSQADKVWKERMKENKSNPLIFDVHLIDSSGIYSFAASRAVINPYTKTRYGYISYEKDFSSFAKMFKQFESREGSEVEVIRADGEVLYDTQTQLIGTKVYPELINLIKGSSKGSLIKEMNQKNMVITYNTLENGNLTVIGSVPFNSLVKHIQPLRNITVVISLISLLIVIILSSIISYYIARPIKQLSRLMAKMEKGEFNVSIEKTGGNDEIGVLTKSFNSMARTINQLIKVRYEMELHKKNAELKALLMQINPHFLYNTLEVINGMADCEGVESISDITQALSRMLRYNLDLKKEKVTIGEEVKNCQHFFLILKRRFEDNLIIESDIDREAESFTLIKTVLQPLIENAIKHGIEKKIGQGYIKLSVKKVEQRIEIILTDNGVGFSPEGLASFELYTKKETSFFNESIHSGSLGLKNVYARLRIFFGEGLDFKIDSTEGTGTSITIGIPAIT